MYTYIYEMRKFEKSLGNLARVFDAWFFSHIWYFPWICTIMFSKPKELILANGNTKSFGTGRYWTFNIFVLEKN